MARTVSHKIVSSKMDILVEHRDYLQTFVDETNQVLHLTTSWLSNEDTTKNFTFTEISKMIDDKLAYLGCANFSVGCEEAATEQEPGATRSFPSAPKSTDQPLPAGHVHVSGVTVASDELKTILSQVNVMQEAMSSLSTSSKILSEKQLAMEKLVESLPDKYSNVKQEKLREIEGELESIREKHKKVAIQQDERMTSFEKKIQDVTDSKSDIVENCHQQQIKIKDQKKETEKLKTQSQQFTKDLSDVSENVQELFAEISVLENNASTNTQSDNLKGEVKSFKESLEKLSTRIEEHLEENGKLCQGVEAKYEMVCQVVTDRLVPLERLRDIFNGKLDVRVGHIKKLENVCDQMADFLPKFSQVADSQQLSMKMMRWEVSAKTTYQRTANGPVSIAEANPEGKFILLENNSSGGVRKEVNLDGWKLKRVVDNNAKKAYEYTFKNFVLKPSKNVKIFARSLAAQAGPNDLVYRDSETWGAGAEVVTTLINENGEEKASHIQKTNYSQ